MSDKTGIEWTDATWNPVTGCAKVSAGCKHCYALREWPRMAANPKTVYYGREFTDVRCHPERLDQPLRWQKPRMIFVNSMSDLFHESVPDAFIGRVFGVALACPRHTFQVLTKRPERMLSWFMHNKPIHPTNGNTFSVDWSAMHNIWIGVSVEDQASADERIPLLLQTPAAVRWISAEPLLGPISFEGMFANPSDCRDGTNALETLDWVVAGGESGPHARPMHPEWVRSLRDQCAAVNVPFMFKQWGEWQTIADMSIDAIYRTPGAAPGYRFDDGTEVFRCGKRIAGRLLDGRTWDGYPPLPNPLPQAGEGANAKGIHHV